MSDKKKKTTKNNDYAYSLRKQQEAREERERELRAQEKKIKTIYFILGLVSLIFAILCSILQTNTGFEYGELLGYCGIGTGCVFFWQFYKGKRDTLSKICIVISVIAFLLAGQVLLSH